MALTPAQKRARNAQYQRHWQAKRKAQEQSRPEVIEAAVQQEAEHCDGLSDQQRIDLADKLADAAMGHLRRAQELSKLAEQVRDGRIPQGFPPR
jgi:hypothetical protein